MTEYYDGAHNRLVFVADRADPSHWDAHWSSGDFYRQIITPRNRFVIHNTRRYLISGSRILEGGCGRGDKVYSLVRHNYDAYGVDTAEKTVEKINHLAPELKVYLGDVRHLQFDDGFFDGYWSLGVIEHFYDGYEAVMKEMHRVIRRGGFLFMTTPTMSWLRTYKAKRGMYPEYVESPELVRRFYQFAFPREDVIADFERAGFQLVNHQFPNNVHGLRDEIKSLRKPLQALYDGRAFPIRVMRLSVGSVVKHFASHTSFYVFQKK